MRTTKTDELTVEQLKQRAPSIFAEAPAEDVSNKYVFVPSTKIIEVLREDGWYPARASETRVKLPNRKGRQEHMVQFFHEKLDYDHLKVGDARVQMAMVNSHDRTRAYNMYGGMFKLICSNGMIVSKGEVPTFSTKHIHVTLDGVVAQARVIMARSGAILERVKKMQERELTASEREEFAKQSLAMRYQEQLEQGLVPPIKPEQLLEPRREADRKVDLWHVFNVVQENVIRGGIRGTTNIPVRDQETGNMVTVQRQTHTQPISNFRRNVNLNQALWDLAVDFSNN